MKAIYIGNKTKNDLIDHTLTIGQEYKVVRSTENPNFFLLQDNLGKMIVVNTQRFDRVPKMSIMQYVKKYFAHECLFKESEIKKFIKSFDPTQAKLTYNDSAPLPRCTKCGDYLKIN